MQTTDKIFSGSIPEIYDTYLGPLLFDPYAVEMAERVAHFAPARVLETAAGTGIVTRAMARRLADDVSIVATDLNQPMLDAAASKTDARNVTWQQADALALPFDDASFDAVVCQFGVMFFPDKLAGYREARRVLSKSGRLFLAIWDRIEENHHSHVVADAVAAEFLADPPRFLNRTPFGHSDSDTIRDQLAEAGFVDIGIETVAKLSRAPSPRDAAIGLCHGTPLKNEIEARDASRLDAVTNAAVSALAERFGNGPIEGKIQAHLIVATRS